MHQRILIYVLLLSAGVSFGQLTLRNPGFVASLDKANVAAAGGGITFDAVTNWNYAGNVADTKSFTVAGSSRYALLFVSTFGGNEPTVVYGLSSMTLIAAQTNAGLTGQKLFAFGLINPSSGANNIAVTFSGAPAYYSLSFSDWSGVNQSTPVNSLQTNTAAGSASPATLTNSTSAGQVVVSALTIYGELATNDVAQTPLAWLTPDATENLAASYTNAAGSSVISKYTYVDASRYWIEIGVAIKP